MQYEKNEIVFEFGFLNFICVLVLKKDYIEVLEIIYIEYIDCFILKMYC